MASSLAGRWMDCIFGSVLELNWVGTGGDILKRTNLNLRVLPECDTETQKLNWNALDSWVLISLFSKNEATDKRL